jgi:hypothetical protein
MQLLNPFSSLLELDQESRGKERGAGGGGDRKQIEFQSPILPITHDGLSRPPLFAFCLLPFAFPSAFCLSFRLLPFPPPSSGLCRSRFGSGQAMEYNLEEFDQETARMGL